MAKVRRRIVHDGDCYRVECAVRVDGVTSPVAEFLDALRAGRWQPEHRGESELEEDEQYSAYSWILAAIEYFADNGEFRRKADYNQLMQGIWEIKRWDVRVTFFDTDGRGNYRPKIVARSVVGGGGFSPLPDFDPYVRLATVFQKRSQKTSLAQIEFAEQVRQEDLSHDRA